MTIALAQSVVQAATSAASPASIAPALGSGSTQGNDLILLVTASTTSGTATIATPANWSLLASVGLAGIITGAIFAYPNNPGSITAVTVTLGSDSGGGAVATIAEFNGVGNTVTQDGSALSATGSSAAPTLAPFGTIVSIGALSLYLLSTVTGITSVATSQEWTRFGVFTGSTNATTNAIQGCYWAVNPGPSTPQIGAVVLSGSAGWATLGARQRTQSGGSITQSPAGGTTGIYVPQFYSGSTGG